MLLSLSKFPLHSPQLYTPSPFKPSPSSILVYAPPSSKAGPIPLKRCALTHTPSTPFTFIPPPSPKPPQPPIKPSAQPLPVPNPPPHSLSTPPPPPPPPLSNPIWSKPPLPSSPLPPASHPPRNLFPSLKSTTKSPLHTSPSSSTPPLLPPPQRRLALPARTWNQSRVQGRE